MLMTESNALSSKVSYWKKGGNSSKKFSTPKTSGDDFIKSGKLKTPA
jgi:hypothetical protein